jgi:hypothetical protein
VGGHLLEVAGCVPCTSADHQLVTHSDFLMRFPIGTSSSLVVEAATDTAVLLDAAAEALAEAAVHPRIHENLTTQRSS